MEQEGELRRTALIVQFKNKTKKMYLSLMMCQMYKREEGVNHEVAGVWLQIWFCFYSLFLFCIYIADEHTRDATMCFTVAVECALPLYRNT